MDASLTRINSFDQTAAFAQWSESHTGRLALPQHLSPLGWVRFPRTASPFKDGSSDPTGGPNSPHVEFFLGGIISQNASTGGGSPPHMTVTMNTMSHSLDRTEKGNALFWMIVVNLNPVSRESTYPFDRRYHILTW